MPFSEIKAKDRWSADSSLKIYLDAVMSRPISSADAVAPYRELEERLELDFFVHFQLTM